MINRDDYFPAGKILRLNGSAGELVILFDTEPAVKEKLESVFLELQGYLVPFFIESLQMKSGRQAMVKLFDVGSADEANPLVGSTFFLHKSLKPSIRKSKSYDMDLMGYTVIDSNFGLIGQLTEILQMPMQELMSIDHQGKDVLIPLTEGIITGIDQKKKQILLDAPEGLIEMYLE